MEQNGQHRHRHRRKHKSHRKVQKYKEIAIYGVLILLTIAISVYGALKLSASSGNDPAPAGNKTSIYLKA